MNAVKGSHSTFREQSSCHSQMLKMLFCLELHSYTPSKTCIFIHPWVVYGYIPYIDIVFICVFICTYAVITCCAVEITTTSHPAWNKTTLSRKPCILDKKLLRNAIRKSWSLFQNPSCKIAWSAPWRSNHDDVIAGLQ